MMNPSVSDYVLSAFITLLAGVLFGGVYKSLYAIKDFVINIILLPVKSLFSKGIFDYKNKTVKGGKASHVLDFLFFLTSGITYILIVYITLDGIFRLYSALIYCVSFVISARYLGNISQKVLQYLFKKIYNLLFVAFYIIFFPIKKLFALIKRALNPFYQKLKQHAQNAYNKRVFRRKLIETEKILKNLIK